MISVSNKSITLEESRLRDDLSIDESLELLSKVKDWKYDTYTDGYRGTLEGFMIKFDQHFNNRCTPDRFGDVLDEIFYLKIETAAGQTVQRLDIRRFNEQKTKFGYIRNDLDKQKEEGKIKGITIGHELKELRTFLR